MGVPGWAALHKYASFCEENPGLAHAFVLAGGAALSEEYPQHYIWAKRALEGMFSWTERRTVR